ncbi:hypothetical protein A167_00050 [Alcanivorax sp. S71-1-4]|nr:hypothetical protein A167_00050 [Alcanivorax sp. S71-1-4]
MQRHRLAQAPFTKGASLYQFGGVFTTFTVIDFPGNALAAEDIFHQMQIIMLFPSTWPASLTMTSHPIAYHFPTQAFPFSGSITPIVQGRFTNAFLAGKVFWG